ncbi:unnamed protein product [Adineta steineri]|uniref:Uncharacterized protein n=2 Tax=Adineta steineri TaxID=433720 RepID=A0A818SKS6_9BILA|nr:unnamed protein product [Adineta steineri]
MTFPFRCSSNETPFFRIILSFHSILTLNRYCHSLKILHLLRSHFSLLKNSLPIILHEVTTHNEIILTDEIILSIPIHSGIYLALLKHNEMKYQPLIDLKLVPVEIFPEKKFLPKTIPFIIYEIDSFVKALSNMIDYMKDYEKAKINTRKYINLSNSNSPQNSISQISTIKRTYRTKSTIRRTSSSIISTEFIRTPRSTSSIIPQYANYDVDIRKYFVTDPERINRTSFDSKPLSFTFCLLNQKQQQQIRNKCPSIMDIFENNQYSFNENDLILFKHHLSSLNLDSSFILELKNCIHQLAIDNKLDTNEIHDILIKLNFRIIHNNDVFKIIHNLQNAVSADTKDTLLSTLMKILFRIDYLEKFNKLDKQNIQIFNERMEHLARMGILNQQSKMFKKLYQLDLFEHEPNQSAFLSFIHNDLQRIIPKRIPLNTLGIKEIIHQLQLNINRLGIATTLILIDNLQQFVHSGLFLILNKLPQLKRYLIQFVEYIQTGRFIGIHLQRLIEQMNSTVQMNTMKKVLLTNHLNSLLQKAKLESKSNELIYILMNLAYQGQLNTCINIDLQQVTIKQQKSFTFIYEQTDIDRNNLQSLLLFLHEQSSAASLPGHLPYQYVLDFIQYLRHFAQLGILYEPKLTYILTNLHKAKDQDKITLETFQNSLEQIKTINYVYAYDHLNLTEFNNFLNDMINNGQLTRGQAWYILDRLIDLCRIEPITNHDIKSFLTEVQLEYNRQQPIYPKLIHNFQILANSYSNSFSELHSLEHDLEKILLLSNSNNMKRISDEVRRRLNDMLLYCKKFSMNRQLLEQLFNQTMHSKFYNKMKEILKTKNLISRKQSLTAIVQVHKQFVQIARLNSQLFLNDYQLDLIHQNIQTKYPNFENTLRHMAELGHLQDKSFVNYLIEHFLSNESLSSNIEIPSKWPFILDLNHSNINELIKHLTQLELQDKIDIGTSIEIQNCLNQIARFGKWSLPQIKFITDSILKCQGKKNLSDKNGFQLIQYYRLILNDITHAIEFEFYIQDLTSENQLSNNLTYRFRHFLYEILHNNLSIDELIRYRLQLNEFHHVKQMDIDQIKRFIDLLPQEYNNLFPLTLTDQLLERLKWDEKIVNESIQDQLLKFERSGVLSQDTFEDVYDNLYHTSEISHLSLQLNNHNQLLFKLFDKINDLYTDDLIDLQQSIEIKEQIYFLEDIYELSDSSQIITIQSRLFNSSNQNEFHMMSKQLKTFVYQEQFRLSKVQDLLSTWHLNEKKTNANEKQIIKLFNELADLNRLLDHSTIIVLNRYIKIKQINQTVYRQFIKSVQRLKDHALINKQAIDCIRSIEARIYKIDYSRRFHELLIKKIENILKELFHNFSHSYEQHLRNDICKKLNELVIIYIKSNTDENSSDNLLSTFDSYITQIKQDQLRSSKTRSHHVLSDTTVPTIASSLESLIIILMNSKQKIDRPHYVFAQNSSFYPEHVPIKYGFRMHTLIENKHLSLWQFSDENKNQIIYHSPMNENSLNNTNLPLIFHRLSTTTTTTTIPHSSLSIDNQIQHRWINALLNSSQSKEYHKQMSMSIQKNAYPSLESSILVPNKALQSNVITSKTDSNKREIQRKKRIQCITYEEHLQRYYLPKWCLTYTKDLIS